MCDVFWLTWRFAFAGRSRDSFPWGRRKVVEMISVDVETRVQNDSQVHVGIIRWMTMTSSLQSLRNNEDMHISHKIVQPLLSCSDLTF